MKRQAFAIALMLFSLSAGAQVPSEQDSRESLKTILKDAVKNGIPGLSMAVADREGLIWTSTAGYADVEREIPVTTSNLFGVGSITKTFVAIVALQLVEEERLALDQTPEEILGADMVGHVANADKATIAQLLNHTSGIPSWEDNPTWIREGRGDKNTVERIWGKTDTLLYLLNVPATNKPGEKFSYSNTNYTLLGLIIETITGNDVVDELNNRIMVPAGLTNIYLEGFQSVPEDSLAKRYHYATAEFRRDAGVHKSFPEVSVGLIDVSSSNLSVEWTAGGMIATASDLARYAAAYRAREFLTPAGMAIAQDWIPAGDTFEVGHGLFRLDTPVGKVIGHPGSVLGYTGALFWHETEDIAVALVANVGTMHIGQAIPGAFTVTLEPTFWELVLALPR